MKRRLWGVVALAAGGLGAASAVAATWARPEAPGFSVTEIMRGVRYWTAVGLARARDALVAAERIAVQVDPRVAIVVLGGLVAALVVGLIVNRVRRVRPEPPAPPAHLAALRTRVARMARGGTPVHLISRKSGVAQDGVRTLLDAA